MHIIVLSKRLIKQPIYTENFTKTYKFSLTNKILQASPMATADVKMLTPATTQKA